MTPHDTKARSASQHLEEIKSGEDPPKSDSRAIAINSAGRAAADYVMNAHPLMRFMVNAGPVGLGFVMAIGFWFFVAAPTISDSRSERAEMMQTNRIDTEALRKIVDAFRDTARASEKANDSMLFRMERLADRLDKGSKP